MKLHFRPWAAALSMVFAQQAQALTLPPDGQLRTWEQIRDYVGSLDTPRMEDVLPRLSTELRSRFALPFNSRSPVPASLEAPGVIHYDKNAELTLRFSGNPSDPRSNRLEVIVMNPLTDSPEPKLITFLPGRKAVIREDPTSCFRCHSADGTLKTFRHIWDSYPDWPGFFGTSHNGEHHRASHGQPAGLKGRRGTSGLPTPEFEKHAFARFLAIAKNHPRYGHLILDDTQNVENMAESNFKLGIEIARQNIRRINARVRSAIRPASFKAGSRSDHDEVKELNYRYYESKRDRLIAALREFGTETDQKIIAQAQEITSDVFKPSGVKAFELRNYRELAAIKETLREAGLEWRDIATTLEVGSLATETGLLHPEPATNSILENILEVIKTSERIRCLAREIELKK